MIYLSVSIYIFTIFDYQWSNLLKYFFDLQKKKKKKKKKN